MGIETIKRMRCDECGATGPEVTGTELPVEWAIAEGWIFRLGAPDLCPDCVREIERGEDRSLRPYTLDGKEFVVVVCDECGKQLYAEKGRQIVSVVCHPCANTKPLKSHAGKKPDAGRPKEITIRFGNKAARGRTTALVNGQYCQIKQSKPVRSAECAWLIDRHCWIFDDVALEYDGKNPMRCAACLDAEKESYGYDAGSDAAKGKVK